MKTIIKNIEYKPMIYGKDRGIELLCHEKYKEYDFYILSLGTHPTAYIEIPRGNKLYYKNYEEIYSMGLDLEVHGGLTYSDKCLQNIKNESWFIGWDYAHYGDYMGVNEMLDIYSNHKKWTTEMMIEECMEAIDQIEEYVSN